MAELLSRAVIAKLSPDEVDARSDEIRRWLAAGAKDGEAAPSGPKWPDGHTFTRAEIAAMDQDTYEANEEAILAQMRSGGFR